MRWRELLVRAALLVVGCGLALLGVEVALRMGLGLETEPYRLRREIEAGRDRTRVLILGDSFSVEWHNTDMPELDFDRSATLLLAELLESEGVHVLNRAERATGPLDYRRQFERVVDSYAPQVVLVNYYVGNDLVDTETSPASSRETFADKLRSVSYVGYAVRDVRRSLWALRHRADLPGGLLNPVLAELGTRQPRQYLDGLLVDSAAAKNAWETNERILLAIARRCGDDAVFAINVFPAAVQVDDRHFEFLRELGFEIDPVFLETRVPQDLMLAFCRRNGLVCFDYLPAFRARADVPLYLSRDTHWNAAGNQLAFELLKDGTERLLARLGDH